MAGRPAYDRETYAEDARVLLGRGKTMTETAAELGLSRATLYRILDRSRAEK